MRTVYSVEISGMTVCVCATKALAEKYVQCMLEEYNEALGEYEFSEHEFYIGEIPFDEK